jgi:hypothetical protein
MRSALSLFLVALCLGASARPEMPDAPSLAGLSLESQRLVGTDPAPRAREGRDIVRDRPGTRNPADLFEDGPGREHAPLSFSS